MFEVNLNRVPFCTFSATLQFPDEEFCRLFNLPVNNCPVDCIPVAPQLSQDEFLSLCTITVANRPFPQP